MGTRAEEPEPDPDKIHVTLAKFERATREVVAGDSHGAIRRILLYAIVIVALMGGGVSWPIGFLMTLCGLVALVLLVATDRLV